MNDRLRRQLPACALALVLSGAAATAQEVIYATSFAVNPNLLTVDPATGNVLSATPITGEEALFGGLTVDGAELYSIDGYNDPNSDRTFRIDTASGAGTVVGDTGANWNFRSVENHPLTDVLYASRDNALYTLDKSTGAATLIAAITGANLDQFTCLAIHPTGTAYGVDIGGQSLFRLNLATGAATFLGHLNAGISFFNDLAFDHNGQLWGVASGGGVYTIDVAGVTSAFAFASGSWGGLAFSGCAAPASYCTPGTTTAGCTTAIGFTGTPSVTASSGFTLTASNVDALRTGLFFYGLTDINYVPLPWGSTGPSYLCVKSPTQRMGAMNSGGTLGCTGSFAQDWNAFMANNPSALGNPRMLGQSFDAQLWMRDPASAKTTVLSDGCRFVLCN